MNGCLELPGQAIQSGTPRRRQGCVPPPVRRLRGGWSGATARHRAGRARIERGGGRKIPPTHELVRVPADGRRRHAQFLAHPLGGHLCASGEETQDLNPAKVGEGRCRLKDESMDARLCFLDRQAMRFFISAISQRLLRHGENPAQPRHHPATEGGRIVGGVSNAIGPAARTPSFYQTGCGEFREVPGKRVQGHLKFAAKAGWGCFPGGDQAREDLQPHERSQSSRQSNDDLIHASPPEVLPRVRQADAAKRDGKTRNSTLHEVWNSNEALRGCQ